MKTQLVAAFAAFGIASAFAADWSYTESGDIQIPEITEASTITISSGKTVTNTTALVGTGLLTVKGGGTLYLTQSSPNFSGGVCLDVGDVAVTTSGAFGTGTVTLHGNVKSGVPSKVIFANGNASVGFDNAFVIENVGAQANPNLYFGGDASGKVTLSGSVTATATPCWTGSSAASTVEFTGTVTAKTFECYGNATYHFKGKVTANTLYAYSASGAASSKVRLYSPENRIGQLQNRANAYLHLDGENAAGGAVFNFSSTKGVELHGYSQVISCIKNTAGSISGAGTGDSGTAILTLTGGVVSATCSATATGAMGYIIDDKGSEGSFTQIQSGGTHAMTGPITVKRGTFSIQGAATYKKVPSIAVEGGTFEIATTASSPFAALTSLSVGAAGKLKIASGLAMPFPNNQTVDVSFATGAAYEGDDIEILAKSLTIDGQAMAKGVWTHEDNGAIPEGITISMVSKKIELSASGAIDFAATYGEIDGYWQVNVASGVTVTNTTALTGAAGNVVAVSGGGTFVQEATSPDFASEIRIGRATVTVVSDRGLGTGQIRISGYSKAGGTSRLAFASGSSDIELPNEIVILSDGGNSNERAQIFFFADRGLVTFTGAVHGEGCEVFIYGTASSMDAVVGADFVGAFRAKTIETSCRTYQFHGAVDADEIYAFGNAASPRSTSHIALYSSENRIGYCHAARKSCVYVRGGDAIGGARLWFPDTWTGTFNVYSNDQVISRLSGTGATGSIVASSDGDPATLTLTGGVASATWDIALDGRMNLVVDDRGEAGDFVQTMTNGAFTMSGTLTVKRGGLDLRTGATFKNVTGVNVSADGTLVLGSAAVFGTEANVKTTDLTMRVAPEATVTVVDGLTVNVHRCWIGEEGLRAGDYTGTGGPSTATVLPQLSGTGILHVGRSSGQGLMLLFR